MLTLMAAEATRVLSRLWLIQQLRHTAAQLEALIDIAQSIVAKRNLDEILQTISTRSRELFSYELCAIFLRDGDKRTHWNPRFGGNHQFFGFVDWYRLSQVQND